jgi:peptidoglycan/xylan/chitin deacetylase (PgdA/CDA1 family)
MVTQTPGGKRYAGYGGFTNFADPGVRSYNIDVAMAAARLGVDDILYDYVRRPDGPIETMVFRGLDETPEESIVSFLAENREALEPLGTFLGASVFGIAATRPEEIAQDVPSMAREVDYISAMTYPSHWAPGEYGVAKPNAQPYEIVRAALEDFQAAVSGTGARLVPWIQDFSLGVDYGPEEVRAQIRAAQDAGVNEFLLWDPEVTYTGGALRPRAKFPSTGTAPFEVKAVSPLVLEPNELGSVPVLMHHQIVPDGGGDFDLTPKEFRDELERLYREGYRPITASDYVTGEIELPAGTSPVVLTFDDAAANQAALLPNGDIDPETAVGIMVEFSETHPDFSPAATFYVNRAPFAAGERTDELVLWLAGHGFELANHTQDHVNLGELSPADVQQQIVLGNRVIEALLPGARPTTIALPLGVMPLDPRLALEGSWDGERYAFRGVMLVGAEPAPSPFASSFDPGAIPRIRSFPSLSLLNGSADWLDRLARDPELRYVSDGDPNRVTFPSELSENLDEQYAAVDRPY